MNYLKITYPDVNNGEGCRTTLWVAGCTHHCKGCHNKHTWDFKCGKEFTEDTLNKLIAILNLKYIKGLTISGGDPIDSYEDVLKIVKTIKNKCKEKDIWLYTGYTLEQIQEKKYDEILNYIDVLVDGEYKEELKNLTIPFRGSTNQRILKKVDNDF